MDVGEKEGGQGGGEALVGMYYMSEEYILKHRKRDVQHVFKSEAWVAKSVMSVGGGQT